MRRRCRIQRLQSGSAASWCAGRFYHHFLLQTLISSVFCKTVFNSGVHNKIMTEIYRYEKNSRRLATILGLVLSGFLMGIGYTYPTPWYFFAPVVLCAVMCLWAIIANRVSGLCVTDADLIMYTGKWRQNISLSEIAFVSIKQWMDSAPSFSLNMRDGSHIAIPGHCIGSSRDFTQALSKSNIPVQIN
jgi:hypothetical protein